MNNYLYKEEIIEHYKHPQNFGKLSDFSASSKQLNPFCGDEVEMFIRFSGGVASDVSFLGHGCAISIASSSIITEHIKGKSKAELTKFSKEDMLTLLGVEVSETRKKCALLGWAVLQDCLK
ncbi:MAG: iron-sulfur cluster assembly scaffold protein [bacterium]|nr:iron-sulfur cluster assembly scaffold protein [bacterium]